MYFVRLIRWIRGYVAFSVFSGSSERLMNLCARYNIDTWNSTKNSNGMFVAFTSVSGYKRMHEVARQAGVCPHIQGRYGACFWIHRYRKRVGMVIGIILFILFMIISQQFIWMIKVDGYTRTQSEKLISTLEELGVHIGTLKSNVDVQEIQRKMQAQVDTISWCALNIRGTTATLVLRERTEIPKKIDTNTPANVVATQDGQIKHLMVTDGTALLRVGDTVRKGEIIVSGIREDRWGINHLIRANAQVTAYVPKTLKIKIPLKRSTALMTGLVEKRRYIDVFGIHIPMFLYSEFEGDYRLERFSETPELFGVEMPFSIIRENFIFYELQEEEISEQTALREATRQLSVKERQQWKPEMIVSREAIATIEDSTLILTGNYIVEENISKQVDIPVIERKNGEKTNTKRCDGY